MDLHLFTLDVLSYLLLTQGEISPARKLYTSTKDVEFIKFQICFVTLCA